MLLGKSVFQSMLTRLKEEQGDEEEEEAEGLRISGLGAGFVIRQQRHPWTWPRRTPISRSFTSGTKA